MLLGKKISAFFRKPFSRHLLMLALLILCASALVVVFLSVSHEKTPPDSPLAALENIQLEGEWKIRWEDSLQFSEAAWNDSHWETVRLPANTGGGGEEAPSFQWLRKQIFIPQREQGLYNAITLGAIHAADEVYFNGSLIGSTGSMTEEWDVDYDRIRIYVLPQEVIRYGDMNAVAVRIRSVYPDIAGIYRGPMAIGDFTDFTVNNHMQDVPLLIVVCILLFSGIIFVLFGFFKFQKGNVFLLLSIFMLLMAVFVFSTTQIRLSLPIDFILDKKIRFSVLAIILPFFMRFLYQVILAPKEDEQPGTLARIMDTTTRWLFIYPPVYILVNVILGDMRLFWALDNAINDNALMICAIASILIVLYRTTKVNRDALFLLAGMAAFGTAVVYDLIITPYSANYTYNYSSFGVLVLVLSMNAILMNRIRTLHLRLAQASSEIDKHNQDLEVQVHDKTKDLVYVNRKLEDNNRVLIDLNEKMKAAQKKLERIASTDSLTGLYNRFEMDKRLYYEMESMERFGKCSFDGLSIIYIDIDNFKYINDAFGHHAGDQVLIRFAQILREATRTVDIVARYGGDEFVVMMPNTDYEGAAALARRIAQKVEETDSFRAQIEEMKKQPVVMDRSRPLLLSYGIAVYHEGATMDDMIKKADAELYAMKASRKSKRTDPPVKGGTV